MSTEIPSNEQKSEDKLAAIQTDLNNKTSSLDEKLSKIADQINSMNQQYSNNQQTIRENTNNQSNRPDPILNPDAYEAYMEQRMEQKVNAKLNTQQRQNTEVANLVNQYPELSDANSDLTKAALKAYNSLSNEEKGSSLAYKAAVQSAALDLGLLPQSKRSSKRQTDETDDIGASNSNQNNKPTPRGKNQKVDEATLAFAQMLGRDINNPEYIKKLEKAANRNVWGKFKGAKDY